VTVIGGIFIVPTLAFSSFEFNLCTFLPKKKKKRVMVGSGRRRLAHHRLLLALFLACRLGAVLKNGVFFLKREKEKKVVLA